MPALRQDTLDTEWAATAWLYLFSGNFGERASIPASAVAGPSDLPLYSMFLGMSRSEVWIVVAVLVVVAMVRAVEVARGYRRPRELLGSMTQGRVRMCYGL